MLIGENYFVFVELLFILNNLKLRLKCVRLIIWCRIVNRFKYLTIVSRFKKINVLGFISKEILF